MILTTWHNTHVLRRRLKNQKGMQLQRRFVFFKTQGYIINQNCNLTAEQVIKTCPLKQILNTGTHKKPSALVLLQSHAFLSNFLHPFQASSGPFFPACGLGATSYTRYTDLRIPKLLSPLQTPNTLPLATKRTPLNFPCLLWTQLIEHKYIFVCPPETSLLGLV